MPATAPSLPCVVVATAAGAALPVVSAAGSAAGALVDSFVVGLAGVGSDTGGVPGTRVSPRNALLGG